MNAILHDFIKLAKIILLIYAGVMTDSRGVIAKAKAAARDKGPDREIAKLSVGWATGEFTLNQVQAALGNKSAGSCYPKLAIGLRDAIRLGILIKAK